MMVTMTMEYLWSELQTGTDTEWKCKRQQIHGTSANIKYQHHYDDDDDDDNEEKTDEEATATYCH